MEPPKPQPPRIIDVPTTVTPVTPVTPAEVIHPTRIPDPPPPASGVPGGAPVHPLAALLMIVVDNLWNLPEVAVVDWPITCSLCFFMVFVPVFFIQKLLMKNRPRRAFAFALLLAGVAAVPFSVTGTPVGLAFLAWSGIGKLLGKPMAK